MQVHICVVCVDGARPGSRSRGGKGGRRGGAAYRGGDGLLEECNFYDNLVKFSPHTADLPAEVMF